MSNNKGDSEVNKVNVRLNETFERLEKKTTDRGSTIENSKTSEAYTASRIPKAPIVGTFLGIFLALIGIGIAGYAVWLVDRIPDVKDEIQNVQNQLEAVTERAKARNARLDALADELGRLRRARAQEIERIEKRVDQAMSELRQSMGTSSEDWLLAEAEYLLRLGNHRVLLERDPKGAIALFQAADKIIAEAEGITAFALREAIASDIAKLRSVREVDIDGIFARLSALKGIVGDLKQKELRFSSGNGKHESVGGVSEGSSESQNEDQGLGQQALALVEKAGARLAAMVEYRSEGEKIKPMLPPEEEYYLRQNLMLKIQLAQLALLRGDSDVYKNSLAEARQWVAEHFSPDDPVTRSVLSGIDEAMKVNIEREMPDVSSSLREVRRVLAAFHQVEESGGGP